MVGTVVENYLKVHDWIAREIAALGRFHNPLLHSGNEVLWNGATKDVVHELKASTARKRLHFDLAITVLAVSAGLFLMTALYIGPSANGFAIRNLWRFEVYLSVITLLQF